MVFAPRELPYEFWQSFLRNLAQQRRVAILIGKLRRTDRPIDADLRVVPADSSVGRAIVQRRALIAERGEFRQHHETVCESFRNPEVALVRRGKNRGSPASEGGR